MATCQFGQFFGHDADECRAIETDRGLVCLGCQMNGYEGSVAPSVFHILGRVQRVESRLDHRFSAKLSRDVTASLVFDTDRDFEKPADPSIGRSFDRNEFPGLPESVAAAAEKLSYFGFRVTSPSPADEPERDLTGLAGLAARESGGARLHTIILCRGHRLSGGQPIIDVKIELTCIQ